MPQSSSYRLGVAAVNQTPIDWATNISNIISAIEVAKKEKVHLLLFPELCICGYGCEDLFLSEWLWEKSFQKLLDLLPATKGITVSIGLPLKWKGTLYNCAAFISDGEILGFSTKQHLANDGVHYEHRWFQPWPARKEDTIELHGKQYRIGDLVYEWKGLKIGYEICEDMWHEEARPALYHQQRGVQLLLNPSASPFTFGKTNRRQEIITKTTKNYNCTYLYADLLGNESGRIIFDGELLIASQGRITAQQPRFSFQQYTLLYQDFEKHDERLVLVSEKLLPAAESKETEFYKAAALGLYDYLRKSRSHCYVLSLSGGADSTVCAVLVRLMIDLGIEELGFQEFIFRLGVPEGAANKKELASQLLHCAYQATENSSEDTFLSAKEVAEEVGAAFYNWKIDDALDLYTTKIENAVGEKFSWKTHDIALQNIQARVRAPFIWYLANLKNGLLLTTSNRSEGDVGYCTMDGDTAGGLAPIAGVDKSFVQHWLRWAEKALNFVSLRHVNNLHPSAELRPLETNQTDEADLMPYPLLARIEELAIHQRLSPRQVTEQLRKEKACEELDLQKYIPKFYRLWQRNQWKRERLAPGFHLDEFNVDPKTWCRFPILGGGFEEELKELGFA